MADCLSFACLGCGVGIGAAVASLRQARGTAAGAPARLNSARKEPGDSPSRQAASSGALDEHCYWLNSLVSILWPRLDEFIKDLVETRLRPAINEALPHVMRDTVVIQRCSLGEAAPSFRDFRVEERTSKAIILQISLDINASLDVEIKAMHLPLGVREFVFRGVLTVVLDPPSSRPPFFGGVSVYCVNPPELDFDFTGAANIADTRVVKSALQRAVRGQLNRLLVVPARIAVDLEPGDDTDQASLRYPEPWGALRILVKGAAGLRGADFALTGHRTSDPYVSIEVGQEVWKSHAVKGTCDPVWEHSNVQDFLVYDTRQLIRFEVYDEDRATADDLLGTAKELPVEHFTLSGQVMDERLEILDGGGRPAGSLVVSTRWFSFTDTVPVKGIPSAVAKGPHQLFLAVRVQDAHGLPRDADAPFTLHIEVGEEYTAQTGPSRPPPSPASPQQDIAEVCLKLHRRGMPASDIAAVTGLLATQVSELVQQPRGGAARAQADKALRKQQAAESPVFDETVRLLLPWTEDIINEQVRLELRDRHGKPVGSRVELPLANAVGKDLHGPFRITPGAALRGSLSTKWFCLP